jgi:hypothetical protein
MTLPHVHPWCQHRRKFLLLADNYSGRIANTYPLLEEDIMLKAIIVAGVSLLVADALLNAYNTRNLIQHIKKG